MSDNEVDLEQFDEQSPAEETGIVKEGGQTIDAMLNVPLNVQIVLGSTKLPVSQVLKLSRGSVVELDKHIGEPVEVMINDRVVARGDLVKVADERVGVTLTEIVKEHMSEL